jgi:hypothetical protein
MARFHEIGEKLKFAPINQMRSLKNAPRHLPQRTKMNFMQRKKFLILLCKIEIYHRKPMDKLVSNPGGASRAPSSDKKNRNN